MDNTLGWIINTDLWTDGLLWLRPEAGTGLRFLVPEQLPSGPVVVS